MKPTNCAIFDEITKLCLHCNQAAEGPQCALNAPWRHMDFVLHAAKLIYGPSAAFAAHDNMVEVRWSGSIVSFDPSNRMEQMGLLLEMLIQHNDWIVSYDAASSRFKLANRLTYAEYTPYVGGAKVAYALAVHSAHLPTALIIAAARSYMHTNRLIWPANLESGVIPPP